jgi:hypothetical protein
MEIKAPTPQIAPAVWTEFKDLCGSGSWGGQRVVHRSAGS